MKSKVYGQNRKQNNKYMPLCQISSLQRKIYIALSIGTVNYLTLDLFRWCITRFTLPRFDEYLAEQFLFDYTTAFYLQTKVCIIRLELKTDLVHIQRVVYGAARDSYTLLSKSTHLLSKVFWGTQNMITTI